MARQRIIPVRRDYNRWVANQTLEDYALRFTAKSARRFSNDRISQTAIGACASNLAATDHTLGEPLLSATASWKGDPSFVLVFRANDANADPPTDVIIVTTADCTPVERITV